MKEMFARLFSIDARSLVFARVSTGILLLVDLLVRAPYITAFLTSDGVAPHVGFFGGTFSRWSLHTLFDGEVWVVAVFFVHALMACAMIVGYRARIATIFAYALYVSLIHASPTYSPGQQILSLMLFLGIFLDWGARALRGAFARPAQLISSPWTCAALIQVALIEFVAGLHKTGLSWREGMSAVNAMTSFNFGTPLGAYVAMHATPFIVLVTYAVVVIQLLSPFILFTPFRTSSARAAWLVILDGMHLVFGVFLRIGFFPFVTVVALALFTPSHQWDIIVEKVKRMRAYAPVTLLKRVGGHTRKRILTESVISYSAMRYLSAASATLFLIVVVVWNAENVSATLREKDPDLMYRHVPAKLVRALGIQQTWMLFAPNVRSQHGWPAVIITDVSGARYDALLHRAPEYTEAIAREAYGSLLWMHLYTDFLYRGGTMPPRLLDYYCARAPGEPVYATLEHVEIAENESVVRTTVAEKKCAR